MFVTHLPVPLGTALLGSLARRRISMADGSRLWKRPPGFVQHTSAALASLPGHRPSTAMAAQGFLKSFRGTPSPWRGLPITMCAMAAEGQE